MQVTIDWATSAVSANLRGVFPDGGSGGSFQLTGNGNGSYGNIGAHCFQFDWGSHEF